MDFSVYASPQVARPRAEIVDTFADPSRWLKYIAAALIILLAAITRLPSPWRMDVTNDEMLHLESYRNHYRSDDISPDLLRKLERARVLTPEQIGLFKKVYYASPLTQRSLIVLADLHPPLYPVMAEIIEAVSRSNLVALRIPSMLASLACILLMYLLGGELKDSTLGLWLATLMTVSVIAQAWAGVGRSYALAQALTAAVILTFLSSQCNSCKTPDRLRSFLLVALVAQTSDWMVWPCIGPLVLTTLGRHYCAGVKIKELLKQSWWYTLLSLVLLLYALLQLRAPSLLTERAANHTAIAFCRFFAVAGPLAGLGGGGPAWNNVATAAFLLTIATGITDLLLCKDLSTPARWGLLTVPVVYVVAALVTWEQRLTVIFIVPLTVLCGLGIRRLLTVKPLYSEGSLIVVLGGFLFMAVSKPPDVYTNVFVTDGPYSVIAERLTAELKLGDIWVGWPPFRADCLYRYGMFPQPIRPRTDQEMLSFLRSRPTHRVCFIFTRSNSQNPTFLMMEKEANRQWRFSNGFVILRLPPRRELAVNNREHPLRLILAARDVRRRN